MNLDKIKEIKLSRLNEYEYIEYIINNSIISDNIYYFENKPIFKIYSNNMLLIDFYFNKNFSDKYSFDNYQISSLIIKNVLNKNIENICIKNFSLSLSTIQ